MLYHQGAGLLDSQPWLTSVLKIHLSPGDLSLIAIATTVVALLRAVLHLSPFPKWGKTLSFTSHCTAKDQTGFCQPSRSSKYEYSTELNLQMCQVLLNESERNGQETKKIVLSY